MSATNGHRDTSELKPIRATRADGKVEYRCHSCRKLLLVGSFVGTVEAFCPRCHNRPRFSEYVIEESTSAPLSAIASGGSNGD